MLGRLGGILAVIWSSGGRMSSRKTQPLSQSRTFWATYFKNWSYYDRMRLSKLIATFGPWFFQVLLENLVVDEPGIYSASGCGSVPWCCLDGAERSRAHRITIVGCCSFLSVDSLCRGEWALLSGSSGDYRCDFAHQALTGGWVGGRELCNWCLWQMNLCYRRDLGEEEPVGYI